MKFRHTQLGHLERNQIVEVYIADASNVKLMDPIQFDRYRRRKRHSFYGGFYNTSPVKISVPFTGFWNITVDLGNRGGRLGSKVNIIPNPIPLIQEADISSIIDRAMDPVKMIEENLEDLSENYDVFISHATEDKNDVVRPLAKSLKDGGLRVWYDEYELRIGDNLRRKIDDGLSKSKFGIVVLSQAFFSKNWPQYELDGLVTREMEGEQLILPIWHKIAKSEVISYSPSLANRLARNTSSFTLNEIATEIIGLIKSKEND